MKTTLLNLFYVIEGDTIERTRVTKDLSEMSEVFATSEVSETTAIIGTTETTIGATEKIEIFGTIEAITEITDVIQGIVVIITELSGSNWIYIFW